MSYIYDIILNFNKLYYEFYEWKDTDILLDFKKLPLFKINNEDYLCFKYDDIKLSSKLIDLISEISSLINSKVRAFLVSDGSEVMGIEIDNNGVIIGRSGLLFDEEEEILEDIIDSDIYMMDYDIINKYHGNKIFSRIISEKREYLLDFFNSNSDIEIYKYLYYDFYEREEKDISKMKNKLFSIFNKDWDNDCDKLYDSVRIVNNVK